MGIISVIVTTCNWPAALEMTIESLSHQSDKDFEILIADSSTNRNQAVLKAHGDYLVFIDSDCIVRPDFIQNHRMLAETGYFVVGNRVLLSEQFTNQVLQDQHPIYKLRTMQWLWHWLKGDCKMRYWSAKKWQDVQGCNLAMWKKDLIRVNGWEERYEDCGYEDSDLVIRLLRSGVKRKSGRFAVTGIHLWNKLIRHEDQADNLSRLHELQRSSGFLSQRGLSLYQ